MGSPFRDGIASPYTKKKIYRRIHNRLDTVAAFSNVRYTPSRNRPRTVVADADPTLFVDDSYPASTARLEIEFIFRSDGDHYWIKWIEPDRSFSCGWHQDDSHLELGACHSQIELPDGSTTRNPADAHPLQIVETRLTELPETLLSLDRS